MICEEEILIRGIIVLIPIAFCYVMLCTSAFGQTTTNDWCNNGDVLFGQGNYETALNSYLKAIDLDPNNTKAWYSTGRMLSSIGLTTEADLAFAEAIAALDKAIKINPQDANSWRHKGGALIGLLKYNEAIAALDKAIKINPQDANSWSDKGVALFSLVKYDEAIAAFDKAIEINPQLVGAWSNKGGALIGLGKYNEAIAALDKAIEIDPQAMDAWNNKGAALKALGRTAEANAAFARAQELGYTGSNTQLGISKTFKISPSGSNPQPSGYGSQDEELSMAQQLGTIVG